MEGIYLAEETQVTPEVTEPTTTETAHAVEKVEKEVPATETAPTETKETTEPPAVEKQEKPVETPEETPVFDAEAAVKEVAELQAKLAQAEADKAALEQSVLDTTGSIQATEDKATAYAKALESIVAEKEKALPENIAVLMPADLAPDAKLEWLTKAEAAVPEPAKAKEAIGRATPVTDATAPSIDESKLSTQERLSRAFGEFFGNK